MVTDLGLQQGLTCHVSVRLGEVEPDIQAPDNDVHPSLWRSRRARIDGADLQIHGSDEQGEISCVPKCVGDGGESDQSDLEALMESSPTIEPKKPLSSSPITVAVMNMASVHMGMEKTIVKMGGVEMCFTKTTEIRRSV
ncbi:hypothetical protein QJS10_CPB15g00474 [Acorus calamus]|uniref:Uncharacterized protein n=1 Tax=Acorus calamus TaxID=4465 RepID=A0AAV9DC88_ACOCL|nr:hypothetical protein QJS10_CPB15g00474 [Acorus calamus]